MEKEESHQFCLAVEQQCPEVQATPVKVVEMFCIISLLVAFCFTNLVIHI